jgi:Protein kinase domain
VEALERGDPREVGRYRILARLGVGGMAVVYLGRSRGGRAVAVKVVHAELAREAQCRERFRREVVAATAAGGGYSPAVLDADPGAAVPWMAVEFLPSVSLRHAVERFGPLPAGSVRALAAGLAEALAAIHRAGIAHLDVKPANVLLTADGPRLIDFGIAADAQPAGPAGSWGFMSPEQVAGAAGPPSDVHSLGATLEYARDPRDHDEPLTALVAECLRPDPATRPTAAELIRRLASAPAAPAAPDDETEETDGTDETHGTGDGWLPPPVMAEIAGQAGAADNPPPPPAPAPFRRRRVLLGTAAVAVVAAGTAAALARGTDGDPPGPRPHASRQAGSARPAQSSATASAPPAAAGPADLEFAITGDGPLTSLAYAVNGGTFTMLKKVVLPWHRTVRLPHGQGSADWRVHLTVPRGTVRIRVLLDGVEKRDERYPSSTAPFFGYPADVDTSGAVAVSGALPGAKG